MDMNLQKYQAFITTLDCGSFTKAAEILDYSQSSISKMISDLESEWGVVLMERGRAGVQPTSDGLAMLPYVRELINSYRKVKEQAISLSGLETGFIRIGTFSSVAAHWLPAIIQRFQMDYPGIRYEFLLGDYSEIERWLMEGRIDCGFLRLPTSSAFTSISLEKDEYVVVIPQNHPLTAKKTLSPHDLNDQPFLLLEHGGKTDVSELLERYDVKPDIRFTTWDDYAILSMVESGLGIGVLPRLILRRIPYQVEVRAFEEPFYREIGLAIRSSNTASVAVHKFLDYLKYRNTGVL